MLVPLHLRQEQPEEGEATLVDSFSIAAPALVALEQVSIRLTRADSR